MRRRPNDDEMEERMNRPNNNHNKSSNRQKQQSTTTTYWPYVSTHIPCRVYVYDVSVTYPYSCVFVFVCVCLRVCMYYNNVIPIFHHLLFFRIAFLKSSFCIRSRARSISIALCHTYTHIRVLYSSFLLLFPQALTLFVAYNKCVVVVALAHKRIGYIVNAHYEQIQQNEE